MPQAAPPRPDTDANAVVRICCITPHQLMNNPRIVKEADALAAAGHDVRVISVRNRPDQSALEGTLSGRRWRLRAIDIQPTAGSRRRWLITGARQKAATAAWRVLRRGRFLAALAYSRTGPETIRLVTSEPTDLIIAHTQPMLAPAWCAARRIGCRWGFDCEDILSEEYGEGMSSPAHRALVRYVEATFIPRADYVTVASPEFVPWLAAHYGVTGAQFVANVPSLEDAPRELHPGYPDARAHLSLYWFSMSIGPLRGLEDVLQALPLLTVPARLHVRGRLLAEYAASLSGTIARLGLEDRVVIHDLIAPNEVVRAAADHDIGLVLSQPCCENHRMWTPNKLYACMMAGLAIAATDTRGHRSVLGAAPEIGFTYTPGDHHQLAERLNALARDPERLRGCRERAFQAARTRFNWEMEQRRLLDVVASVHVPAAPAAAGALKAAQA